MELAYAGGGLGKGGKVTLYTDGKKVGEGNVDATLMNVFSADDGCDVGEDTGAPVSPDYGPQGNAFNGKVKGVLQLLSKKTLENTYRPTVQWAYLDWQASRDLNLKLGRTVSPIFLLSDYSNLNYSQTMARPPSTALIWNCTRPPSCWNQLVLL